MRRRWNFFSVRREARQPDAKTIERRARRTFWLLTATFGAVLWAVLAARAPVDPSLQVGKPSPLTVQARRDVRYRSEVRTEEARAQAEIDSATVVYKRDTEIPTAQRNQLTSLLQTITQVRDDPTLAANDQRTRLEQLPNSTMVITEAAAGQIIGLNDDQWQATRQLAVDLYDRAMRERNFALTDLDVKNLRERSLPYWASQSSDQPQQVLAVQFAATFLRANQIVDDEATARRKQEAREAVDPVQIQILRGESVIREGDIITPEVLEKLDALGQLESDLSPLRLAGRGVFAALAAGLLGTYLWLARSAFWRSVRRVLVVYGMALVTLLLARLVVGLPLGESWPYAFPLGAAVLLLTALYDSGVALLFATILSVLVGLVGASGFGLTVALLFSSVAGIFALGRAGTSFRFLIAGVTIALVEFLVLVGLWLATSGLFSAETLPDMLAMSGLNGLMSVVLALGLYNLIGQLAGVVTPFQLMELSNPTQPLLRKLTREAPGTYYHSVSVGNLAESAAESIGADALLLRVAAYYHDIGKAARPYFYTDNQSDRENVHNDLDPRTSAQIIADHVREGVNMARSAKLPEQIIAFIPTHHGTSIIQHFYQLALREEDTVDVSDFRYPGPKPQTREQAILMLADSVEATVRAKSQHGKLITARQKANGAATNGAQTLEELVASIVEERVRSGQLDESPLTLSDLSNIRQAFVTTLQGIYHPRVEYAPQLVKTG